MSIFQELSPEELAHFASQDVNDFETLFHQVLGFDHVPRQGAVIPVVVTRDAIIIRCLTDEVIEPKFYSRKLEYTARRCDHEPK
jgi:hypothetical protein